MILTIIPLFLTCALMALEHFDSSATKSKLGFNLVALLLIFSVAVSFSQNKTKDYYISSLEQIATGINWVDTDVLVDFGGGFAKEKAKQVRVWIRIYKENYVNFPDEANLTWREISAGQYSHGKSEYRYINEDIAERMWHAFSETEGLISYEREVGSGVEQLRYYGAESAKRAGTGIEVSTRLFYGLENKTNYSSLSDLNGTCLSILAQARNIKRPTFSSLKIWLNSNAGTKTVYLPIRTLTKKNRDGASVQDIRSDRYLGVCIPPDYFQIGSRRS